MKRSSVLGPIVAIILACVPQARLPKPAADRMKRGTDIYADLNGNIDIPDTLTDCAMTIDDFITMVQTWVNKASSDAAAAASPDAMRAQRLLNAAQAYKASLHK